MQGESGKALSEVCLSHFSVPHGGEYDMKRQTMRDASLQRRRHFNKISLLCFYLQAVMCYWINQMAKHSNVISKGAEYKCLFESYFRLPWCIGIPHCPTLSHTNIVFVLHLVNWDLFTLSTPVRPGLHCDVLTEHSPPTACRQTITGEVFCSGNISPCSTLMNPAFVTF